VGSSSWVLRPILCIDTAGYDFSYGWPCDSDADSDELGLPEHAAADDTALSGAHVPAYDDSDAGGLGESPL